MNTLYPAMISGLPEADIPFEGVKGWLLQGEERLMVFFEIDPVGEVAPHSHGDQWGLVIEGEMKLTIGNETRTYRKGDNYFIPAGTIHSATFRRKTYLMDLFAERNRYLPKKKS